jgi:predicted DCC family thiol-disulfide oxidoreductase YuxK
MDTKTYPNLVFFDGVCNLCNGFVEFLVRHDRKGVLKIASLQGKTAQALLKLTPDEALSSVIFLENGVVWRESTAVLKILANLGPFWKWVALFRLVPTPIRDGVYRWVARNRYRWFGKRETCRLPTPEERGRFLD